MVIFYKSMEVLYFFLVFISFGGGINVILVVFFWVVILRLVRNKFYEGIINFVMFECKNFFKLMIGLLNVVGRLYV